MERITFRGERQLVFVNNLLFGSNMHPLRPEKKSLVNQRCEMNEMFHSMCFTFGGSRGDLFLISLSKEHFGLFMVIGEPGSLSQLTHNRTLTTHPLKCPLKINKRNEVVNCVDVIVRRRMYTKNEKRRVHQLFCRHPFHTCNSP